MKCPNPLCDNGWVSVMKLLDTPQEMYLLAQHFPNNRPHIAQDREPCPTCCPMPRRAEQQPERQSEEKP